MRFLLLLLLPFVVLASQISIQVLGSGGPESGERASASYLVKQDGKARVLIDFGGGAFLRFAQAKAKIEDLELILLTHLHIDHVAGLPALMKAGYFSERTETLNVLGPKGNEYFPGLKEYLQLQFGPKGAYRYMSDILSSESESFSLLSYEVGSKKNMLIKSLKVAAIPVNHGIVPTLAYKVELDGKSIVFSGDTTAQSEALETLSKDVDILIAHHAISAEACPFAKGLHMTPQRIAEVAALAKPKRLLLSHRMKRTLGSERQSETIIRQGYKGKLIWAEDLMEITLP